MLLPRTSDLLRVTLGAQEVDDAPPEAPRFDAGRGSVAAQERRRVVRFPRLDLGRHLRLCLVSPYFCLPRFALLDVVGGDEARPLWQ